MSDFDIEIDRYMLDCAAKGLSPKTMKSFEQTLKLFARYMDDTFKVLSHKEVTAEHLRAYMRSLSERGKYEETAALKPVNYPERRQDFGKPVTQTTIANYTRNIKAFYSHLHKEKVVRKNPMKTVQNVKPERKAKIMLEDNELKQFFRSFDVTKFDQYRDWIIARLIFDTGCRISELLAIVPTDIDLRANAILLRETKNNKQRFVYFSDKTSRHLKS
ncbi:site-specific integrase [Sporosarcina sp. E16_8]|nr:site-specific integrase [Sporosarcina sp. E16_8]